MVRFSLLSAGYCTHSEAMAIRGGKPQEIRFPALVGLVEHPKHGPVLFDTGYTSRFHAETATFPASLYARITPVFYREEEGVAYQLAERGIRAEDVRLIVLSHFHADHVAGARDFPNARFVCFQSAYQTLSPRRGLNALRSGFLPGLLPDDFEARALFLEDEPIAELPERYYPFEGGVDLFGDGSVWIIDLPGHALGHLGMLVEAEDGSYLLIGDACWLSRSFRENLPPHPFAHFLFPDTRRYGESLAKLHSLYRRNQALRIIPSHCSEVWQDMVPGALP